MNANTRLWITVGLGLILLLLALALPGLRKMYNSAKQAEDISNAKQLGVILFTYANDNNGKYPDNLEEAMPSFPDNLFRNILSESKLQFKDNTILNAANGKVLLVYFPGHNTSDPPDTILFQSPDKRITYTLGGSTIWRKPPPNR